MSQTETGAQNKKLTRTGLFSMAIGQIIGVGIMTMTGIAIGFTGRSVNLAYLLAGVLTIVEGSARRSARVRHGRGVRF